MTKITTVGLDLAKSVFQVHCADEDGRPVVRKTLRRAQVIGFFSELEPCLIGMEACGGAHHWARGEKKSGVKKGRTAWQQALLVLRPTNVVLVAMANKTAHTVWAMLSRREGYKPEALPTPMKAA